jgi:nitrogen-specific signal transduction histidine kinase
MNLLEDSSVGAIVGNLRDVTERKRLEEQFRQAQKMQAVGRLAGGIAHDFNNLLTIILGYCEIVLEGLRPSDPLHDLLEQIEKAGKRASVLTNQLLAFSRKQVLQPRVLELNVLVAEMEKMLGRLIGEDVDLAVAAAPDLWRIKADVGQMEQVLMNLAINARDAMTNGGKLTIETDNVELDDLYVSAHSESRPGEYVRLAVTDSGCGMDPVTMAQIFEPFFSTKGDKGTGLGLATVYGIVKQSGGHIEVYSEVGIGTTFKVYLPRDYEDSTTHSASQAPKTIHQGNETVLLTEDEDAVRALAKLVLQRNGYRVLEARHGGEALLLCEQTQEVIDLLVTDVVMPNMNGRQVAERLKTIRPEMKVLFLSGYTDDAIVRHGVLDANMHFLQKPFTAEGLAQKVRTVLDTPV